MKNTKAAIEAFMQQKNIAVVGASRNKDKFGTAIYREMKANGYKVYAVNPNADMVEGDRCYAGLGALPAKVDGVIVCIPPTQYHRRDRRNCPAWHQVPLAAARRKFP